MAEWDDNALLECFVVGREDAFREVYDRYYEKLFVACFGILRNTQDAEDVVIITLTKLFERHGDFKSLGQLRTWLFLSARNSCIDLLRRRRVQAERDSAVRELGVSDVQNQSFNDELDVMLLEKILDLVGELPAQSQQVIRLRYLEGLKYREIAERLRISPRTVENLVRYALDRLRNRLGHQKLVLILLLFGSFIS